MPSSPSNSDRAFAEIDAMRTITTALASLRDAESRTRVLAWVREHFGTAKPGEGALRLFDGSGAPAAPRPGDFSALALGDDLFEPPAIDGLKRPVAFVPVDHGPQPRADSWRRNGSGTRLPFQLHYVARALRRFRRWQRAS